MGAAYCRESAVINTNEFMYYRKGEMSVMNKKINVCRMILLILMFVVCAASSQKMVVFAAATDAVSEEQETLNGWVKADGNEYYYEDGKFVTGWKTIGNDKYYFDSKGVLQKNKMISKNKYVDGKGKLVDKSKIYSLGKSSLKKLKTKLKKKIKSYRGTYSVYVKNLDTNEYLVINNKKMKPASLIKLYNMGTVYEQINKKKLKSSKTINAHLKSMITVSSNDSYNILLGKIGKGNTLKGINTVNKFCKAHGYKDTRCGATLTPSYCKQVYTGKSSLTTTRDCGHILEDIYRGNLVSESASKKMLNLLKKQTRKSKIPAGLPKGVKSANKTGEYSSRQHDAAIVFSKKADYIIVIMSEGDPSSIGHIRTLSKTTYDYFN